MRDYFDLIDKANDIDELMPLIMLMEQKESLLKVEIVKTYTGQSIRKVK